MAVAGKINVTPVEEKTQDDEPLVFANKQVVIMFYIAVVCYGNMYLKK